MGVRVMSRALSSTTAITAHPLLGALQPESPRYLQRIERYAHLAPDHLATAASRIDSLIRGYDLATRGNDKRQANTLTP
jgi:hypothetical protein